MKPRFFRFNLLSFLCLLAFLFSCQKEIEPGNALPGNETVILEQLPVILSVTGKVIDENLLPVSGATITGGGKTVTTDVNGTFRISNGNFNGLYATVQIRKDNYFTLVKTLVSRSGNTDFILAQLSPRILIGKIGLSGGTISYASGKVILNFPANSFVNAAGSAYSDSVKVYATYIDPSSADVNDRMPGNLMGIDRPSTGYILETFGMLAVELTDAANQPIQIAPGKKVNLTAAIPASLQATAPASVPLWFFDESKGVWVKEGSVTKNGNVYTGDVAHFTYWNIDVNLPSVFFKARFLNSADSSPLAYKFLSFKIVGGVVNYNEYTDSAGYTAGYLPRDLTYQMRFYRTDWSVALDTIIGPYTTWNNDIGNVYVNYGATTPPPPPPTGNVTFTGTMLNCNGQPVYNGMINLLINNQNYPSILDTGEFSIPVAITGSGPVTVMVTGTDNTTGIAMPPYTFIYTGNNAVIGNIFACSTTPGQFISYNLDGVDHLFLRGIDSAFCTSTFAYNRTNIACRRANGSPTVEGFVAFITGPTTVGGTDTSSILTLHQFTTASTPPSLNIVSFTETYYEYPPIQGIEGWVNGKFTCVFRDQLNNLHTITSHFKMWRRN